MGSMLQTWRSLSIPVAEVSYLDKTGLNVGDIEFRKHLYLFPNRLEIGVDSDPHVWPLEEIIGIQENVHRSYRCIQIRLVKDHKRSPNYSPIIGIIVYRFIYSNVEYFEF